MGGRYMIKGRFWLKRRRIRRVINRRTVKGEGEEREVC